MKPDDLIPRSGFCD